MQLVKDDGANAQSEKCFELVINGFNNAAFSQQNLIEQGDDFGFMFFLSLVISSTSSTAKSSASFFEM